MKILGIDPGLITTGFGLVEIKGPQVKILDAGTIKPNPKAAFEERVGKVYQHITNIISDHKPQVVVLEKLYAHYKHPTTACILGHVRGVICLAAYHHNIELEEHSVKRIRKALLGNGNASKQQVQDCIKRIFKLQNVDMALDTSDALALSMGYAHMKRVKIL